jgi:hemoglobin
MKKIRQPFIHLLLAAAFSCVTCSASAQTPPASHTVDTVPQSPLFVSFGGMTGLTQLIDNFMVLLLADARTSVHFQPSNQQRVKEQLKDQFCFVLGGPCVYRGADMQSAHANLDITKSAFNALVEVLQKAMDAQGIPFSVQNQLLAKLAPMHRDVITLK